MKILLLNQSFVSPDEPGHTRHFEMARYLRGCGHELVIVGSDSNYQTGLRTVDRKGLFVEQVVDGVRIFRAYSAPTLHRSYFWRFISFFSFMFSSVWTALQVKDADLIMGTTPPIFQAVSAWLVALVRRKPFLLEVRDLWPEFAISPTRWKDFCTRVPRIFWSTPRHIENISWAGECLKAKSLSSLMGRT
jgi:hypothetical protein